MAKIKFKVSEIPGCCTNEHYHSEYSYSEMVQLIQAMAAEKHRERLIVLEANAIIQVAMSKNIITKINNNYKIQKT